MKQIKKWNSSLHQTPPSEYNKRYFSGNGLYKSKSSLMNTASYFLKSESNNKTTTIKKFQTKNNTRKKTFDTKRFQRRKRFQRKERKISKQKDFMEEKDFNEKKL
jgi:hypothetical protein